MESTLTKFILGSVVSGMTLVLLFVFVVLYQKRLLKRRLENKLTEDKLRKEELKSAYSLLEGQESERQRIAEDLHDHVGGLLASIANYSQLIDLDKPSDMQREVVDRLQDASQQAVAEVRRVSHALDLSAFDHDQFLSSLQNRIEILSLNKGLKVESNIDINATTNRGLLRDMNLLILELMTNTVKHAKASTVFLEVIGDEDNAFSILYKDNGKGMAVNSSQKDGMGMKNIRSRAEKYHGVVELESAPGAGVSFSVVVPPQAKRVK